MEDGQKISINLEAPLDTKSSDMLVSVNDVKFAHNRQKFQGHVLPNSLRYERNGWAAGWYVYDFKMGGGYIFSRNQSNDIYLAATRSKLNNTPTYIISFHTASNNDLNDPEAVSSATQFQVWYTLSPSINARECEDASIDSDTQPVLSFNYAVEGNDYKRKIKFNWNAVNNTTTFSQVTDAYGSADLTMEYVDRSSDGTVTAILYNNEIHWDYEADLYIPKDLIDSEGYKVGKFENVANEVINWKLGNQLLQYDDAQNKFIYDEVTKNPGETLLVHYTIPFTYTVPLHKYYSSLTNISWSMQGTRSLFNNESSDTPSNIYRMSLVHITDYDVNVYDNEFAETGVDGPDISVVSQLVLDIDNVKSNAQIVYNVTHINSTYAATGAVQCTVPVLTLTVPNFKLPNDDEIHDVTIQLYLKYNQEQYIRVADLDYRPLYVFPITYPLGQMSVYTGVREPLSTDRNNLTVYDMHSAHMYRTDNPSYVIDDKQYDTHMDYEEHVYLNGVTRVTVPKESSWVNVNSDELNNRPRINSRDIVGRLVQFNAELTGVNGINYSDPVQITAIGVNTNLAFSRRTQVGGWEEADQNDNPFVNDNQFYNAADYDDGNEILKWRLIGRYSVCGVTQAPSSSNDWHGTVQTHVWEVYVTNHSDLYIVPVAYDPAIDTELYYEVTSSPESHFMPERDTYEFVDPDPLPEPYKLFSYTPDNPFSNAHPVFITGLGGIACSSSNYINRIGFGNVEFVQYVGLTAAQGWDLGPGLIYRFISGNYNGRYIFVPKDSIDLYMPNDEYKSPSGFNSYPSTSGFGSWWMGVFANNTYEVPSTIFGVLARTPCDLPNKFDAGTTEIHPLTICNNNTVVKVNYVGASANSDYAVGGITGTAAYGMILNFGTGNSNIGISADMSYLPNVAMPIKAIDFYDSHLWVKDSNNVVYNIDTAIQDYWIGDYTGTTKYADIENLDIFSFDIMDNKTGELLVDHNKDIVNFNLPRLRVHLDNIHMLVGKIFYNDSLPPSIINNSLPFNDNVIDNIYKNGSIGQAFFPFTKDRAVSSQSIYKTTEAYGLCNGIAVFNTSNMHIDINLPSKYLFTMFSPLNSYILPPKITGDKLYVYAGMTYTNHISFEDSVANLPANVSKLLDDNSVDIATINVTPRSDLYDASNVYLESGNIYYTDKTFLTAASISYYNNKIHITYKPASGNTININGSTYDLGTSDMSIKQEADLTTVYLPEHVGTKHNMVLGNHDDVLTVADTKDIINTIADTEKHWVDVEVTNIDFTQSQPEVSLQFTEKHENRQDNVVQLTYTDVLNINHSNVLEYSDENQIVMGSYIDGDTDIVLPVMPSHKFIYPVSDNTITVDVVPANSGFVYDYASNTVKYMYINNKDIAKASLKLTAVNTDNQAYDIYHVDINQSINTYVYFKHFGIYKVSGTTMSGRTAHLTSLSYNEHSHEFTFGVADMSMISGMSSIAVSGTYVFNFDDFDDKTKCTPRYLVYTATDVRNPDPETQTKEFARVMADDEYQLIKQHWDSTVATENFWWIDPTHTLELTKDRFILKEKDLSGGYDDWNGDKWNTVYSLKRTDYLTSECDTYIVSSATGKNARGYLYILRPYTDTSIQVTIYDLLDNMQIDREWVIEFKHIPLSTKKKHSVLNDGNVIDVGHITVCTYSDIVSSSLLSDCKLTAVNIKGTHWLGIQYDKNFNQWSFALGNRADVIQGYGVIGINGYATGGMIPAKYFGANGFNDEVYNIADLEAEEGVTLKALDQFNIFKERIVGDENQQWYISDELTDIVMAVDLDKGNVIKLPITNKYSQIYSSPSYAKYTVHALGIQIKQLMDMIIEGSDNAIWKEIIKYAMFPIVWYLSPYTNVINYLQQTLGQYAYTHFNSTSISHKSSKLHDEVESDNAGLSADTDTTHIDALMSDDLSFDVVHIPQEQSFKDNSWDNILGIFASMVVSATDLSMRDVAVNTMQNQSAVSDIGKKFSQAFLQNIGSMSVTGFTMQSTKPMLKSEVTAVKTLDMFYSTSAEQNCFAGPGFVNMQFVAQCTAQSVTSVQLEAQQTQMFMLLKELTTWQGKATIFLLDQLKDFMFKMSDNIAGQAAGVMPGVQSTFGWIAALVLSATGYALVAAKALTKLGIEVVDSMLTSFFPSGVKTTVTAQLSRHNYDVEGKHAYGNKSEQFFWPCADCKSKLYTDETVEAVLQEKPWPLEMPVAITGNLRAQEIYAGQPRCITETPSAVNIGTVNEGWDTQIPYNIAMCKGSQKRRALPDSTAFVIGTESFMPTVPFKNENIGEGEPVFTPPAVQDYIIDKNWNLFVTAMAGDALWVSCKDTKLFDGNYSNIIVTDDFCGVAAPHVVVEIKRNISEEYLRPWAVSPDAIALNITGLNCAYDEVAYHAFDGYGYRITDWLGASGMNKERYTWQYCFQVNDRFKRSNKLPPNQFMGNFQALPSMSLNIKDKVFNEVTVVTEGKGLRTGVAGENKDTQRYALPIFTEQISSLPAIVRALSPYKLAVIDGITSLTTDVRISQSVYKIPDSVDFNINDKLYRMTNEYICSVSHEKGLEVVKYLVPALGLTYLGATPFMAYFYNQATRQYYIYQGGNTLQVMDMLERFRDIKGGIYDFINQEVVMPCLATMTRLDKKVKDDTDETDNIVIPVYRHNKVGGEITPPIDTIFNTRSWYRTVSIPAGLVFQGPNRCIINRFVWSQYMLEDIKNNKGKWIKVPREEYHPYRTYAEKYSEVNLRLDSKLKGWTHNPFLLVTSPLGVQEEVDCKFEWEITFAWTAEMEQLYADNEYVTVNVMAETMTPGGKVFNRPTHIYLHKELFTRSGNFGYYSFRYQGNNGIGNRERLHIWSDGYIAVSSLQLEYKTITERRNEVLVIQEDLKGMKEM